MINAVIFDMDGLLIDTEPLWDRATMDVFDEAGIAYSQAYFQEMQGMRIDLLFANLYERQPWSTLTIDEVTNLVIERTIELIKAEGRAMPGALQTVAFFKERSIPIAIASSSSCNIIEANIAALGINDSLDAISSAFDEQYGKPHPAVYLSAAKKLGVPPRQCLIFEDAIWGVLSAKAAEATCICVPAPEIIDDKRLGIADIVLPSLNDFDEALWLSLNGSER